MKQFFKFALILAFLYPSVAASAGRREDRRAAWREKNPDLFSVNFAWGGYPSFEEELFKTGGYSNQYSDISIGSTKQINEMYSDYRGSIWTTGLISGEFNYNCNRWFNASAILGLCPIWSSSYDGYSYGLKQKDFAMAIFVMPKAKIMYCNKPIVRVYSSLAAGLTFLPGFSKSDSPVTGAIQLSLVGVEIGRKWFGSFELGAGTLYSGAQIGFGFKF